LPKGALKVVKNNMYNLHDNVCIRTVNHTASNIFQKGILALNVIVLRASGTGGEVCG
jgi:hypothetical protein